MTDKRQSTIYYEFWKDGSYVKTGFKILGNMSITTGIDTVPTMSINIPITELPTRTTDVSALKNLETNFSRYEIHVFIQTGGEMKYVFFGIVDKMELNFESFSAEFQLSHRIARMREWIMPVNYTVKNTDLDYAIGAEGCQLGWSSTINDSQSYKMAVDIEIQTSSMPKLELTFSSTNKLAALTEACEATENLHWRVDLTDAEQDHIIISEFGAVKDVIVAQSPLPDEDCSGTDNSRYVTMLTEPTYSADYTDHYNRAVVFCGDIGYGILHLTLKAVYDNKDLWDSEFPLGMYEYELNVQGETEYTDESASEDEQCRVRKLNNERVYNNNEALVLANNDNREYYVTDTKTLNEYDDGVIKQVVYNFSDLYPIPDLSGMDDDCKEIEYMITDDDRLEITKRAYWRAIRKLKNQRPVHTWQFNCGALPNRVADGDKITFMYTKKMFPTFPETLEGECVDYDKERPSEVANITETLYMTKRTITFDNVLNEYTTMTLDEEIRPRALNAVEIELHQKIEEETAEASDTTDTTQTTRSASITPSTNVNKHYTSKDTTYSGSQIGK